MNDKFIDLCVDDNHSAYGNEMPQKHLQFKSHLEKLNGFRFETGILDMPLNTEASSTDADPSEGEAQVDA